MSDMKREIILFTEGTPELFVSIDEREIVLSLDGSEPLKKVWQYFKENGNKTPDMAGTLYTLAHDIDLAVTVRTSPIKEAKRWSNMADAEKLENVRKWRDYFKSGRDLANKEVEQLEAEVARLKTANKMMLEALEDVMTYAETLPEPPAYYQGLCIVTAYAKGEWGE